MNLLDNPEFAKAQRAYDLMLPNEAPEPKPFDRIDVLVFIEDFSNCGEAPDMWLEDQGVFGSNREVDIVLSSSETLRDLCIAWMNDSNLVEKVCPSFYATMELLAYERWASENEV